MRFTRFHGKMGASFGGIRVLRVPLHFTIGSTGNTSFMPNPKIIIDPPEPGNRHPSDIPLGTDFRFIFLGSTDPGSLSTAVSGDLFNGRGIGPVQAYQPVTVEMRVKPV